ncbi:MAG: AI-2E family transporter [Proteobacteria bacterium]|nr:AI-2E family transporter [Candidatus Enterousia onthequi]
MNGIIVFLGFVVLLWFGRSILIPLLVAVFLWYLINAIAAYFRKVMPFNYCKKMCPRFWPGFFNILSILLSTSSLIFLFYTFATQINPMFSEFVDRLPEIQNKLITLSTYIFNSLGLKFDINMFPNLSDIIKTIGTSAANIATSVGMILIYILFLFVEQSTFHAKMNNLFESKSKTKKFGYIVESFNKNMKKYLFVKTFIAAATGICAYIWLYAIGLEFAGVWAFLVFIMNYIPTIGSFVACSLPILYALISGDSLHLPILTASGLIVLEILFGNILDPKMMGKTLNLSTLAILINLVFWGGLWGIAGMFFSVPILAAIFIITAQFDSTRWIAVLLSADGQIPDKTED